MKRRRIATRQAAHDKGGSMKLRMPSPALAMALLALVVAMSGSAVAASVITSAQIKNGTIQLKDLSKKTVTQLRGKNGSRGPNGPQGAQGLQGAPGATGPVGPSNVFTFVAPGAKELPATFSANLAAGSYLIFARMQINNNATKSARPRCALAAGGDEDIALPGTSDGSTDDDTADGTLMVTHTFSTAGTVKLECESSVAPMGVEDVSITAIRVGSTTVGSL